MPTSAPPTHRRGRHAPARRRGHSPVERAGEPAARRPVQRPQRAGGRRDRRGAGPAVRRRSVTGLAGVTGVPGPHGADRSRPAVRRDRGLRPLAGIAARRCSSILAPVAGARGGGLVAVFGSAGERDVAKRPMMGRIAGERCRLVVVTDEDPRGEDAVAILEQIAAGAEAAGRRPRRGRAVHRRSARRPSRRPSRGARPGDVVLLAGKGHEQSIIMTDGPRPWDERAEADRGSRPARVRWTARSSRYSHAILLDPAARDVAVLFALVWFGRSYRRRAGSPPTPSRRHGFTGTDTKVEVKSDLPPRILIGHADSRPRDLDPGRRPATCTRAASTSLSAGSISSIGQFATVSGTLPGVTISATNGDPITDRHGQADGHGTPLAPGSRSIADGRGQSRLAEPSSRRRGSSPT